MTALRSNSPDVVDDELSSFDEQRHMLLDGVSWDLYERLLAETNGRNVRMTYDEGRLEIMSPLPEHERPGQAMAGFILLLAMELDIPICSLGSTTLRREEKRAGLEPDQCFYVQNEAKVRAKKRLDFRHDPPPDLAIEVDITHRSVPKMPLYGKLRVPEVWRLDENGLKCHLFTGDEYTESESGRAFPMLRVADLEPFLRRLETENETAVMRSFRDWVRRTFLDGGA